MPEGREQFQRWPEVGFQGRLRRHPGFRVSNGLEHATSPPCCALNETSVDEKQEKAGSLGQRLFRPELRIAQVIFEVQSRVPDCVFKQSLTMLVVTVHAVVSNPADPIARQLID
jgi:hypothetical protein